MTTALNSQSTFATRMRVIGARGVVGVAGVVGALGGVIAIGAPASHADAPSKRPTAPLLDVTNMVEIPASSFRMGHQVEPIAPYGDPWFIDQRPEHVVALSPYRIDRREVTVAEFAQFLTYAGGDTHFHRDQPIERVRDGYLPIADAGAQPIRQVTWLAADHYCRWAGKRLPTEAEWERAAAGTEDRVYPWGADGPGCARAAFFTGTAPCTDSPLAPGAHAGGATPDGVEDLAGNVAEWTADWYGPYASDPATDPTGPAEGTHRVVRGGGFLDGAVLLRAQARTATRPGSRSDEIGFRCAFSENEAVPARRDDLALPEDVDRQPSERPRAQPAPTNEVVADGLFGAGAIVERAGTWYVAQGTRVVVIEPESGVVGAALEGLGLATGMATDGVDVYVTDSMNGDVWRVRDGEAPARIASGEATPGPIAAVAGQVVWATASALRTATANGTAETILADLDGVTAIALTADDVVFAEAGATTTTRARIARVPRAGGAATTIVPESSFAGARPTGLAVDLTSGRVYFSVSGRAWPYPTLTESALLAGDDFKVHSYSPPQSGQLVLADGQLVWSALRAVARFELSGGRTFDVPAPWARATGLFAGPSGVVYTDAVSGRVYRLTD